MARGQWPLVGSGHQRASLRAELPGAAADGDGASSFVKKKIFFRSDVQSSSNCLDEDRRMPTLETRAPVVHVCLGARTPSCICMGVRLSTRFRTCEAARAWGVGRVPA